MLQAVPHADLARCCAASASSRTASVRTPNSRLAARRAGTGVRHERGRSVRLRAAVEDDSTFGKPQAPRDLWENYAKAFRKQLFDELAKPEDQQDVIIAALYAAGEDDAISSRTAVRLPIEAYVDRVESLAQDIRVTMEVEKPQGPAAILELIDNHLYKTQNYRCPSGWKENFSPYRTYLHNVLAQKVGVPATLGAIHLGVLRRLQKTGEVPFKADVVLSSGNSRPFAREGDKSTAVKDSVLWTTVTPEIVIRGTLETLKRAFWAWDWEPSAPSGFLKAARAALGDSGRVGSVVAGTVMQPTGRPFGDVERAALATERLMLLDGGVSSMHARDLGVLRFHQGRYADALSLLKGYLDSPAGKAAEEDAAVPAATILVALPQEAPPTVTDRATAKEEVAAVRDLVLRLERLQLEGLYNKPTESKEIE